MEPKFQSSFIPKGPTAYTAGSTALKQKIEGGGLLAFLAWIIFIISVLLAAGMFGYKFYLKYRIDQMGTDLENARTSLQLEVVQELIRVDNRIISGKDLVSNHVALTPLFEFLEASTPRTVRLKNFTYSVIGQSLELTINGEARGYAALALLADIFSKSQYFKDSVFSNLSLNEKGDVNFSFKTMVNPDLVSYRREIESLNISIPPQATSTQI